MTEQENREKAIAEMTRHFGEMARCHCECDDSKISCYKCFAIKVYDAGYRKADEVRKETAKEFIELFHKYVIISEDTFDGTVKMNITDAVKMNEEIEKRFGVEVEG